ncbi:hypothetical protein J6590_034224 [Homalodisca vitripennis]|nr:hypothetical protein J6590_034224 [Homalodisca vitripennis]
MSPDQAPEKQPNCRGLSAPMSCRKRFEVISYRPYDILTYGTPNLLLRNFGFPKDTSRLKSLEELQTAIFLLEPSHFHRFNCPTNNNLSFYKTHQDEL